VHALFDGLLADFPKMEHYLSPTSEFVHSPRFETAIMQLQKNEKLTDKQGKELEKLKVCDLSLSLMLV
jgi:hypothetical protein